LTPAFFEIERLLIAAHQHLWAFRHRTEVWLDAVIECTQSRTVGE